MLALGQWGGRVWAKCRQAAGRTPLLPARKVSLKWESRSLCPETESSKSQQLLHCHSCFSWLQQRL